METETIYHEFNELEYQDRLNSINGLLTALQKDINKHLKKTVQ